MFRHAIGSGAVAREPPSRWERDLQIIRASDGSRVGWERVTVRVGDSHSPMTSGGANHTFLVPPAERLVKREPRIVAWAEELADGSEAFVKLYIHRDRAPSRTSRSRTRACREYDGLSAMERTGAGCTPPLFWGWGRSPERGRVETVVTRYVSGARPLRAELQVRAGLADELGWKPLFATLRRMHRAGVHHCALSAKNILLDSDGLFYVADLAKSMSYPNSIEHTRMALYDYVHLIEGLHDVVGRERCRRIVLEGGGDRAFADLVLSRAERYQRGSRVQHKRLRAEFHLRHIVALATGGRPRPAPVRQDATPS